MNKKSIYKYAAEGGVPVGIYLTLMATCLMCGINVPILQLIFPLLFIGFPIYLWSIMRKVGRIQPAYMKFSSLWLLGIYSVIFGCLICMFFSGIYVVFINPGFIHEYFANVINNIELSGIGTEYPEILEIMDTAEKSNALPSGMQFVTSMGWLICFCGSVLSLILSLIITSFTSKAPQTQS